MVWTNIFLILTWFILLFLFFISPPLNRFRFLFLHCSSLLFTIWTGWSLLLFEKTSNLTAPLMYTTTVISSMVVADFFLNKKMAIFLSRIKLEWLSLQYQQGAKYAARFSGLHYTTQLLFYIPLLLFLGFILLPVNPHAGASTIGLLVSTIGIIPLAILFTTPLGLGLLLSPPIVAGISSLILRPVYRKKHRIAWPIMVYTWTRYTFSVSIVLLALISVYWIRS